MKKITLKKGMLAVAVFLFISGASFGQTRYIDFTNGLLKASSTSPHRTYTDNGLSNVEIEYQFSGATLSQKQVNTTTYDYLDIKDFNKMSDVGKPALPAHNDIIAVPDNASVTIEILETQFKEISGFMIHPALKPATDTYGKPEPPFEIDQTTYSTNAYFPKDIVGVLDIQKIRGTSLATIQICPVQFNPVTKTIKVYSKIKYRITFEGVNKSFQSLSYQSTSTKHLLGNIVLNSSCAKQSLSTKSLKSNTLSKDYIIITHSNFNASADSLAKWKRQLGYEVEVFSKSSWTAAQVKDTIHRCYTRWMPDYFVIIGDHDYVPGEIKQDPSYGESFATDLYYACVDGVNDYYPDIAHGRISVISSEQAMTVVQKIINYERNPVSDSSFFMNGLNCAMFQDDYNDGYEDRRFLLTSEEIRDYLINKNYTIGRVYKSDATNPLYYNNGYYADGQAMPSELLKANGFNWNGSTSDIVSQINNGRFYVLHRDHGYQGGSGWHQPYFVSSSINSLSNGNKLPVVFSMNCHTGEFLLSECFAEKFLRKSSGGAVGIFAASYYSYSGYNDALTIGMFDAIWSSPGLVANFGSGGRQNPSHTPHGDILTMGQVLNQGLLRMVETWNGYSTYIRYQNEIFHYFGDPAMKIWTDFPRTTSAIYPSTIYTDENSLSVTHANYNTGVATLYYNGNIIGKTTLENGSGTIYYTTIPDTTAKIMLTISGTNYRPLIANINVAVRPIDQGINGLGLESSTPGNGNPGSPGILANGWSSNSSGSYLWQVNNGTTSTSETGPSIDHTLANGSGIYLYTEASSPALPNDTANLITPQVVLNLNHPTLEFWYHMYGQNINALFVDINYMGEWVKNIFNITGQQQSSESDQWEKASIDLINYIGSTVNFRFRAINGSGEKGDIAIDDINIVEFSSTDNITKEKELIISLYPNPSEGMLDIVFTEAMNNVHLSVMNIQGKVLYNELIPLAPKSFNKKLNLNEYSQGIYFIKLENEDIKYIFKVMLN